MWVSYAAPTYLTQQFELPTHSSRLSTSGASTRYLCDVLSLHSPRPARCFDGFFEHVATNGVSAITRQICRIPRQQDTRLCEPDDVEWPEHLRRLSSLHDPFLVVLLGRPMGRSLGSSRLPNESRRTAWIELSGSGEKGCGWGSGEEPLSCSSQDFA
jgi:hypothetical protein